MQCSVTSSILVAAGPLTNVVVGGMLWIILNRSHSIRVHMRYFLWLTMAFNMFDAAGYLGLGAITGFGDWGALLGTVKTLGRVGLALGAALLYYGSMHAVASVGRDFLGRTSGGVARGRRLTLAPYFSAGIVAAAAALVGPLGLSYVWVAVAASFGAGVGLLAIHDWGKSSVQPESETLLTRGSGWLVVSAVISALFVFVVGRGLTIGP